MPHIIVEYSQDLDPLIPDLLSALHESLAEQNGDRDKIKTRAIRLSHTVVGEQGANGTMVHATLLLLEGRDQETKKRYGNALKTVIDQHIPSHSARTLEIRDMVRDTYFL